MAALDAGPWPAGKRVRAQFGPEPMPALGGLFDGIVLPNAWILENGKQPFRITALTLEPGAIVVTFEPLRRHGSSRLNSHRSLDPGPPAN